MAAISLPAQRYGLCNRGRDHAIGGYYQGHPLCCRYSDITVFSFHPVKIITTAEGGMATCNSSHLAQRMYDLRSHGITKDANRFEYIPGSWAYEQQDLGFNYRITELQAALGLSQLERLDYFVSERQRQFQLYQHLLPSPVDLLKIPQDVYSALHLSVIRLHQKSTEYHRLVFEGLRILGVGVQLHYSPVHLQPYYRKLGFSEGDFPFAEAYASNAFSLPLFPGLSDTDQRRVVSILESLVCECLSNPNSVLGLPNLVFLMALRRPLAKSPNQRSVGYLSEPSLQKSTFLIVPRLMVLPNVYWVRMPSYAHPRFISKLYADAP